jgi:hypothetical protein
MMKVSGRGGYEYWRQARWGRMKSRIMWDAEPARVPPPRRGQRALRGGRQRGRGIDRRAGRSGCPYRSPRRHRGRRSPPGDPHTTPPRLLGQRRAAHRIAYRRLEVRACRRDSLKLPAGRLDQAATDVVAALSEIIGFAPGVLHTRKRHALAAYLHPEHAELAAAHEVYLA